jgi:hypothetical protein
LPLELPTITDRQLKESLSQILQGWPLYRQFHYLGAAGTILVPQIITLYCESCANNQFWETDFYSEENDRQGFKVKQYKCRNCGYGSVQYYFYWGQEEDKSFLFFKAGQYPELEERVSASLQKALVKDIKLYKNALRLRNFNFGIGAVAYMRRVIENHMNDLVDTIFEAAQTATISPETLKKMEEIKASRGFQDKIAFAESILPPRLRPDGVAKPFGLLYDLTSDGLHARSEEECIAIFDGCRKIFEYVFAQIHEENEVARQFKADLANAPKLKPSSS